MAGRACLQCSVLSSEAFSSCPAIGGHGDCNVAVASQQANLLPSCVGSTRPAAAAVSVLPRAASIAAAAAAAAASSATNLETLWQPRPAALMACPPEPASGTRQLRFAIAELLVGSGCMAAMHCNREESF